MPKKDPYEGIRTDAGKAGSYDIVGQYDWTSIPRNSGLRKEAPSAYITAYELQYSQLRSFIDGYMNILSPRNSTGSYNSNNPGLDFYKGLYTVNKDPIARFNFPFFGDSFRSFSSEFADTFSPISQRGAQMFGGKEIQGLGAAAESIAGGGVAAVNALATFGNNGGNNGDQSLADKVAKVASDAATGIANKLGLNPGMQTIGAPGSYIETPKFYQYSNTDNGLQIAFTLSNTLEDDSIEKNFNFICDFTKINRPFRYGPIGMNYPAIYNLVVPGLRYIQWASLENFEVSLLGNRRKIGNHIIPEAYVCQFTFRSLTVEPSNFIDEICEERSELGSFEAYAANQLKEELEFEKGKGNREKKYNERRALAAAINNRPSVPLDPARPPGDLGGYAPIDPATGKPRPGIVVQNEDEIVPDTDGNAPQLPADLVVADPRNAGVETPNSQQLDRQIGSSSGGGTIADDYENTPRIIDQGGNRRPDQPPSTITNPNDERLFAIDPSGAAGANLQRAQDLQMVNRRTRPSGMSSIDFERAQRQAQKRLDDYDNFYAEQAKKEEAERSRRRREIADQSDEQVRANERAAERRAAEREATRERERIEREKEKFLRDKQQSDARASGSPNEPIGSGGFGDF